jgi:putative ABC transport system ATP-binding protein
MTEGAVAARVRNLTKTYGDGETRVVALDDVTIDLMAGEFTAVMGPSGSGKSTLMHCLAALDTADSGSVMIGDQELTVLKDKALTRLRRDEIGFVFQSYNLVPTLTATENVMLALDLRGSGMSRAGALAAEALRQVGLSHRAHAMPSKMSGGEKQRVAIARALAGSPSVILADEPTAALDSENGKGVMALLAEVAKERSRAILVVTHDHRTLTYADRLIRIEDGKIVGRARARKLVKGSGSAGRAH